MGNRGRINPSKYVFKRKIEEHVMSRFELALHKRGAKWMQSAGFKKIVAKIGIKYAFTPIIPDMCKVRLNRKFKSTGGMYYFDTQHVDISYKIWKRDKKEAFRIIKHEIVHLFIDFNDSLVNVSNGTFEKVCMYAFGFNGDHGAYPYMYTCKECGAKRKMSEKKEWVYCKGCDRKLVTQKELDKIIKIKEIGSEHVVVKPERFGLFKETVLIDI